MTGKVRVDYDSVESLSSVVKGRSTDASSIGTQISDQTVLAHAKIKGPQKTAQSNWSRVLGLLSQDLEITSGRIDSSVTVYQKGDESVGVQFGGDPISTPDHLR